MMADVKRKQRLAASRVVIVSDLDGTLLDRQQRMSEANKKAISRFRKAGGIFIIATGRPWQSALPYANQLQLKLPLIVCNGAELYDPVNSTVLCTLGLSLSQEQSAWLYEQQRADVGVLLYSGQQIWTPSRNETILQHEQKDGTTSRAATLEEWQKAAETAVKLLIVTQTPETAHLLEKQIEQRMPEYTTVFSETTYMELLPQGCSKGAALRQLAQVQGWKQHVIAVGDQMNDWEMLRTADIGIATANAVPALQQVADALTVSHEHDALAHVIEHWIELS